MIEETTDLPDGSEVALELVDDVLAAEMPEAERALLERSIETARAQAARGEGVDGEAYLKALSASRR